jgi:hypothetical protein
VKTHAKREARERHGRSKGGASRAGGAASWKRTAGDRERIGRLLRAPDAIDPASETADAEQHADRMADAMTSVLGEAAPPPARNSSAPEASEGEKVGLDARIERARGAGHPLDAPLRADLEGGFGADFTHVRVHADARAAALADDAHARAFASGRDVFFATNELAPASPAGRHLIAHELAHVVQQGQRASGPIARKPRTDTPKRKPKERRIKRVTFYVDQNLVALELDDGEVVGLKPVYNGRPQPGVYRATRDRDGKQLGSTPPITGTPNEKGFVVEWRHEYATFRSREPYTYLFEVVGGRGASGAGTSIGAGTGQGRDAGKGAGAKGEGPGASAKGSDPRSTDGSESGISSSSGATAREQGEGRDPAGTAGRKGDGSAASGAGGDDPQRLLPEAEAAWRELYELTKQGKTRADGTPAELVRLYEILRSKVKHPVFTEEGESWVRFARFLDANRDKIEGIFQGAPRAKLTVAKLEQIILQYGRFVATEPVQEPGEKKLDTLEGFEREFQYDPGWARLSPADRRLLLDYARISPDALRKQGGKIDFPYVTTSMKMMMALKLSRSWAGAIRDQAIAAFTDWKFVTTLVVTLGIYVGLWLTPDPSFVTKALAGILTGVLLTQFAIEDIYGLYKAWSELAQECGRALTVEALQQAGDRFATKIGQVGFDILLFIVTWRVGKSVQPKLRAYGAERGVMRAEAAVRAAEAKPGSGAKVPANPEGAKLLDAAKADAKSAEPGAVLDALAQRLPEPARKGLATLRASAKDANALKAVEGQARKGDLARFLEEKGLPESEVASVRAGVAKAQLRLARMKLIEMQTASDPKLRARARAELIEILVRWARGLRDPKAREVQGRAFDKVIAELGESIQRTQLREEFSSDVHHVLSNVEVVRKVASVEAWKASEIAAGREPKTAKLRYKGNEVFESVAEIDGLVCEEVAGGKLKPVRMEQAKTGRNDSPTQAASQNTKALTGSADPRPAGSPPGGLEAVRARDPNVRVFERADGHTLGTEYTSRLELSNLGGIEQRTRGPSDKGFNLSFGFPLDVLEAVGESLVRNPAGPIETQKPPSVSPERREDVQRP